MGILSKFKAYIALVCIGMAAILNNIVIASELSQVDEGYVTVDDGRLYYKKIGSKSEYPILVLHGGPGLDSSYLLPQMAELAKSNEVIFYDQRGSGKSLGFDVNEKTITMDSFIKDIEELRKHFGCKKFIILGHSWGGLLAMRYATLYPENLSSLILLSSAPATSTELDVFIQEYYKKIKPINNKLIKIAESKEFQRGEPTSFVAYYRMLFALYFYNSSNVNKLTLSFSKQSALNCKEIERIFLATYFKNYDLNADLNKLKFPVLILHGSDDIIPVSIAESIQKNIPGSKIEFFSKCNHFAYIEQPIKFFSAISEFLKSNNKTN